MIEAFADAMLPLNLPVDKDMSLDEVDGVDSVSRVRLFMCVEERLGVMIKTREGGGVRTFKDLELLVPYETGGIIAQCPRSEIV